VFLERFRILLCYVPLHFTSRWFARKHYPVSLHRYNFFLDHLRSLGGFYCFCILLHLLFYGPPSHRNPSPTASHILPIIPFISFHDFKSKWNQAWNWHTYDLLLIQNRSKYKNVRRCVLNQRSIWEQSIKSRDFKHNYLKTWTVTYNELL